IVNAIAVKFVFDDKGKFAVYSPDRARVRHALRAVSAMRSAQEAGSCFPALLDRTDGRLISEDEGRKPARVDAILLRAINPQRVVRRGAAEPVSCCDILRVAARAGVAEHFRAAHAQNKTELVVVRVASFS